MESLDAFESDMEADGQGSYSLFPALDSIANLSGTPETLDRLFGMSDASVFYPGRFSICCTLTSDLCTFPVKLPRSQISHGWMLHRYYSSSNKFHDD